MAEAEKTPEHQNSTHKSKNWFSRNWRLLRIYIFFVLFIVILFSILVTPWGKDYISMPLNKSIAILSGFLIGLLGTEVTISGTQMFSSSGAVDIKEGCNGIYATVILLAGVIAFPAGWKQKLIGVIFGTTALFLINLVRVITLFYLSRSYPQIFDEAHLFVWQFIIIIIGALLWLLWYDKIVSRSTAEASL